MAANPRRCPPPALPPHTPAGNLARYLNHSCSPNVLIQAVLRQGDSGVSHCMGLFAGE